MIIDGVAFHHKWVRGPTGVIKHGHTRNRQFLFYQPSYELKIETVTPFWFQPNDNLNVSSKCRMIIGGVAFHHKWVRGTHGGHQTRTYAKSAVFILSALV